jgi:hypothetical protein
MDKKLKTKWVKALTNGKIKQGRGELLNEAGAMCCIGVLGRICGVEDGWLRQNAGSISGTGFDWLESKLDRGTVDYLVDLNDGRKDKKTRPRSFKQIAKYIEKNL